MSIYTMEKEANIHYHYPDIDEVIEDTDILLSFIQHHKTKQVPRLQKLLDYYIGENTTILQKPTGKRRKEPSLSDNRATHNFGRYVSQFIQGYMTGKPIRTSFDHDEQEKVEEVMEYLKIVNKQNHADEKNSDISLDQSVFGRAYELVYRVKGNDGKSLTKFTDLDVLETFVIYDESVDHEPIGAVRYIYNQFKDATDVYLYTSEWIIHYVWTDKGLEKQKEDRHYFNGVPIIECENDKYRLGDFENIIRLIDLYDSAQSDTANYMSDLNDAMLKIAGDVDLSTAEAKEMKDANIVLAKPKQSLEGKVSPTPDVDYIYKKYDVQGTEAYKDRLFNNMLLFTSIPNLLDDKSSAGGAQSGEALKMKLFALAQKRANKERLFRKFLTNRYTLISNMAKRASEMDFDTDNLNFTFTENLPSMVDKEMEWFSKAGGELSNETLWEQLSIVHDPAEEKKRIEREQMEYNQQRDRRTLGVDFPFAEVADGDEDDDD